MAFMWPQEIVGNLLDVTPSTWLHPKPEPFPKQKKAIETLCGLWRAHDWTRAMGDGGDEAGETARARK